MSCEIQTRWRLTYQLSDWHLGEVRQAQVHFITTDFILQVQHFAAFTHSGVWQKTHSGVNEKYKHETFLTVCNVTADTFDEQRPGNTFNVDVWRDSLTC